MEVVWEIAGWAGAAVVLSAYLAVSMGWSKVGSCFQIANLLGACAFIVNGAFHQAWPSVVTNIAWFLISSIALLRLRSANHQPAAPLDAPHVHFPGAPDATGQLAISEVLSDRDSSEADGHSSS